VDYPTAQSTSDATLTYNSTGSITIGQLGELAHYNIWRGYTEFDTSSLTSTDVISSAQMMFCVTSTCAIDTAFDLMLVSAGVVDSPLISSDYGVLLGQTTSFGSLTISTPSINAGWLFIDLNTTGIDAIQTTTTTRFALRS
jgi:hypothetical protein